MTLTKTITAITAITGFGLMLLAATGAGATPAPAPQPAATLVPQPALTPRLTLQAPDAQDQDDLAFWLHPTDLARSTIITSDKKGNRVFVYDLEGKVLQTIAAGQPGNIDTRYGFALGRELVDLVVFNERRTNRIRVYRVDPASRQLTQIDDDSIDSGPNYGLALYKNPRTGRVYVFTGPKAEARVRQYELVNTAPGRVAAVGPLRELKLPSPVEGIVADDQLGQLYLAEEAGGIWKFAAEPNAAPEGRKIAAVGEHGLAADVEGLALYYLADGRGYLIASSQGSSSFRVYDRQEPHAFRGSFAVGGVMRTDGIEVVSQPLDARFPGGVFASHNGRAAPAPVQLVKWDDVATALGLQADPAYWDPRPGRGTPMLAAAPAEPIRPKASQAPARKKPAVVAQAPARDATRPTATAALVAAGKVKDDEGYFQVQADCRDNRSQGLRATAHLNGMAVAHGQKVKLERDDDDETKIKLKDDVLKVEAPDFRLVVGCRDAAGNEGAAVAAPVFAPPKLRKTSF